MTASIANIVVGTVQTGSIIFPEGVTTPVSQGASVLVIGSVDPSDDAPTCQWVLSSSGTVKPTTGWETVSLAFAPLFGEVVTFATAGVQYVWFQDPATGAYAVSPPITVNVVTNALAITYPTTAINLAIEDSDNNSVAVTGTVAPISDAAEFGFSTTNSVAPTSWTAATNDGSGNLSATLNAPSTPGQYYLWAKDTTTNLTIVTSFTVGVFHAVYNITWPPAVNHDASTGTYDYAPWGRTDQIRFTAAPLYSSPVAYLSATSSGASATPFQRMIKTGTNSDGSTTWVGGNVPDTPGLNSGNVYISIGGLGGGVPENTYVSGTEITLAQPAINGAYVASGTTVTPAGPYAHGTAIAITNFATSGGATALSFAVSASDTVVPTSWTSATGSEAGDWTLDFNAPGSVGTYYLWIKTNTGAVGLFQNNIVVSS